MQTTIWMMAAAMAVFCSGSVTAGPVQDLPVQTETENGGDGDAVLEGSLSAADQIAKSIVSENGGILFEIPEGTVQPETLKIHISGRVEYEDGFSASVHYLEEENGNWKAGMIYFIPYDPACTELTMDIFYTDRNGATVERSVDLLAEDE